MPSLLLLGVKLIDRLAECENRCYTTVRAAMPLTAASASSSVHPRAQQLLPGCGDVVIPAGSLECAEKILNSSSGSLAASSSAVSWSVKLFRLASYPSTRGPYRAGANSLSQNRSGFCVSETWDSTTDRLKKAVFFCIFVVDANTKVEKRFGLTE